MSALLGDVAQLRDVFGFEFTEEQRAAITADLDQPVAIIAGAGSGKTAVMAARVVWLVGHEGVLPEHILGLTFTNKAAGELGRRVRTALDQLGGDFDGEPTTSTYHAFAGSLIAEHGLRLGIEPDLRIVDDATRFQRAARAVATYDGDLNAVSTHVPAIVSSLMKLDGQLSEHLVDTETLREHDRELIALCERLGGTPAGLRDAAEKAATRIELSRLVDRYRELKSDDGVLDFSDQMAWGARLAELPDVGADLRERFRVVLLDEYQDTSVAQRDLLQSLFSGHPITAVGDPAQAIYGWRGAASGNLEGFLDDFPAADGSRGRQFALTQTRRCAPEIIDAANALAAPFYGTSDAVQPLTSANPAGGTIDVALYPTVKDEIEALVASIRSEDQSRLKEIGILVRVGRENGEIVAALRAAGIPFEIVGLDGLLAQPEVLDLLAVLELVEDVTANPAMLRLLTGPRWRIGPRDLALLGRRASSLIRRDGPDDAERTLADELAEAVEGTDPTEVVSLADAVDDPGDLAYSREARERFAEVSALIRSVRAHVGEPLLDVARRAVRALDLDVELEAGHVTGGSDNVALLLEAIAAYAESDRYASLSGLIAYLDAENFYADGLDVATPSEANSVKLLTIHRAKGLEWRTVYVPLMSATIFPSGRGRDNWTRSTALPHQLRGDSASLPELAEWTPPALKDLARAISEDARMEELRLAYVAYTRAERRLVLSGHQWGRTQQKPLGPSPFLESTAQWLAARGVEPLVWAPAPDDQETNPHFVDAEGIAWPAPLPPLPGRRALADAVRAAMERLPGASVPRSDAPEHEHLDRLAEDIELLIAESDAHDEGTRLVPWPARMSATSAMALTKSPADFARGIARPMPRRPSREARFGTRFHAWIEDHYGMTGLFDPTDLPGRGDAGIDSDAELDRLKQTFLASEFATRTPDRIEAPFSLVLGGQQFSGRIDAVFSSVDEHGTRIHEVVDWKTNAKPDADPLQLAIYRLAWAELMDVPIEHVTAAFYYVRLGITVRPDDLLDRPGLEHVLGLRALT